MLTNDRLWVGTGNGVILSVPLVAARPARDDGETTTSSPGTGGTGGPGGAVRVYSNEGKDGEATRGASFMPYCSMVSIIPLGTAHTHIAYIGEYPSPRSFMAYLSVMTREVSQRGGAEGGRWGSTDLSCLLLGRIGVPRVVVKVGSHIIAPIVSIAAIVCNHQNDWRRTKRLGAIKGSHIIAPIVWYEQSARSWPRRDNNHFGGRFKKMASFDERANLVASHLLITVMFRFSARGAFLLLVPQGRALIRNRALISFLRNGKCAKQSFDIYLKWNNNRNCKSNKYTVNIHLMVGNFENHKSIQCR